MGWASDAFNNSMIRAGAGHYESSIITSEGTYKGGCYYSNYNDEEIEKENKKIYSSRRYTKYYDFPTEKQQKAMNFITNTIGVVFEGKTKKEASQFIKEYLEEANKII